jgi:hypothetical protein
MWSGAGSKATRHKIWTSWAVTPAGTYRNKRCDCYNEDTPYRGGESYYGSAFAMLFAESEPEEF